MAVIFSSARLHNWIRASSRSHRSLISLRFNFNHSRDDGETTRGAGRDSSDMRPRIPQFSSFLCILFRRRGYSRHVHLFFSSLRSSTYNVLYATANKLNDMTQLMVFSTHCTPLLYHPRARTRLRRGSCKRVSIENWSVKVQ